MSYNPNQDTFTNYISDPNSLFAAQFVAFADAAATSPADMTGGSPNTTFTRNTSSPLGKVSDLLMTKSSGASRQGEGAAFTTRTIESADLGQVLEFSFDYKVASGTYVDDAVQVWAYDVANSVAIQLAPTNIKNVSVSSRWSGVLQVATNATTYRIGFFIPVSTDSANTIKFSNFYLGRQIKSYGPAVTDWVAFNSTGGLTGGTTSHPGFWRRVGDSMEVQITATYTAVFTGGSATYTIPSGYTIDTAKFGAVPSASTEFIFGVASILDVGAAIYMGNILYYDTTKVSVSVTADDSGVGTAYLSETSVTTTVPMTWANGDKITMNFKVPITGWSSGMLLSSDADTRVVAVNAYSSVAQSIDGTPATIVYGTETGDTHSAFDASTGIFTVPVPGWYQMNASVGFGAVSTTGLAVYFVKNNTTNIASNQTQNTTSQQYVSGNVSTTQQFIAGDTIRVKATQTAAAQNYTATQPYTYLSISKVQGPSQIAASESVNVSMTNSAGTSISTGSWTTATYNATIKDSHGAVSSGVFTAPISGMYLVTGNVSFTSSAAGQRGIRIIQSGSTSRAEVLQPANGSYTIGQTAVASLKMLAGDTAAVQVYQDSGGALTLQSTAAYNTFSVTRVGNY